MNTTDNKIKYILQIADNAMISGERLAQLCGHASDLEQDIALSNLSLDHIGQAKFLYNYAAQLEGNGKTEDDYPFMRLETSFYNLLLTEQPNTDFAHTIVRLFLFDNFNFLFLSALRKSNDAQLAAFAKKSLIEVKYHLRYSTDWVLRLGDGTEESHDRIQVAIDYFWNYRMEAFVASDVDIEAENNGYGVNLKAIIQPFTQNIERILTLAKIKIPEKDFIQTGGKIGRHTENLGHILAEMQYMQRAYPGLKW